MKELGRSFSGIIISFIIVGLATWHLYFKEYRQEDTVSIHEFPREICDWNSIELPISDDEYSLLETRNAFTRKYIHTSGRAVYLFIVYSQKNRKVTHPPELCYKGSGANITNKEIAMINLSPISTIIRSNVLALERGNFEQITYYWFKVGGIFTPNYWRQQFLLGLNSLFGKSTSSALIRISADVTDGGVEAANDVIKGFAQDISPFLIKNLP